MMTWLKSYISGSDKKLNNFSNEEHVPTMLDQNSWIFEIKITGIYILDTITVDGSIDIGFYCSQLWYITQYFIRVSDWNSNWVDDQ